MNKFFALAFLILSSCSHAPQKNISTSPSTEDIANIKSFAGCYAVDFKFVETFPTTEGYQLHKPQNSKGIEYVVIDHNDNNEIHLQHILVSNRGGKLGALKHWRQEWIYNPSQISSFQGYHEWKNQNVTLAGGNWNQRVTQTDDSPRYECIAQWVNKGKDSYWECQSWNPLPRREYTSRSDYQVLDRMNRQRLTSYGWIHEQDSAKLQVFDGKVTKSLVKERGENTYTRISDDQCQPAQKWWSERRTNWKAIRNAWNEVRRENPTLKFNFKTEEGELIRQLDKLDDQAARQKLSEEQVLVAAKQTIDRFVIKSSQR